MQALTERETLRWLRKNLREFKWRQARKARSIVAPDLVGDRADGRSVAVAIKRLHGPNRIEHLKGAAAMAVLELQQQPDAMSPLVILYVDRLGPQVVDKLAAYLDSIAPNTGWVVLDAHDGVRAHMPEFGVELSIDPCAPAPASRSHSLKLFSDLNAWMLKLLLMQDAPSWAWTAARGPFRNPRALAKSAGVSDATAHRFVKVMTEADHVRQTRSGLTLVRTESLLQSWRAAHRASPPILLEVRPVFELDPTQWGLTVLGKRLALGGGFAARHFELAHATDQRRTLWVEGDPRELLDAAELVPAEPGHGQLWIGRPQHVESCFRARVIAGGQAFIDPCELMLDSALDPTRGLEQSDYLLERILAWSGGAKRGG